MTIDQKTTYEKDIERLEAIAEETKNPKIITDFVFEYGIWRNTDIDDIPDEKWVHVAGHENRYMVSDLGRFKSLSKVCGTRLAGDIILKQKFRKDNGYLDVAMRSVDMGAKSYLAHRVVGRMFIDNIDNLPQINHTKGCKLDNRVIRLEWSTSSNNLKHGFKLGMMRQDGDHHATSKLNWDKVREIRRLHSEGISKRELGDRYGVHFGHINNIVASIFWKEKKV